MRSRLQTSFTYSFRYSFTYSFASRTFALSLLLLLALGLLSACSTSGGERVLEAYLSSNEDQLDQPASVDTEPVRFEVEPGTPARVIGQNLQRAGLIKDELLFEAYVRLNGLTARMEAGTFILSPSMTMLEIVDALQQARADSLTITLPEGWRVEQVADFLLESEIYSDTTTLTGIAEAYRQQALSGDLTGLDVERYPFLQERPAGASLEGYLFPDTYDIPAEVGTHLDLISRQLDNFAARVVPLYETAVAEGATTMSLFEVLTIASIVEREAVVGSERGAIAAVYLNRLEIGMRLEADPTVQYAMGYQAEADQWWKTPVFLEEYSSVISPYNTYLNPGMPPGPIAAPGIESIQAVLNPDEHDYIYFVATPGGTGGHVFAETWDEHVLNVQRYQSGQ
ncbi:MAG: endolytic transglycosylase MltG [Litorilinea sp.]